MNDSIVCYSTKGNQPHKLWASNVGFGYEHAPSMQVEKRSRIRKYQRRTYLRAGSRDWRSAVETQNRQFAHKHSGTARQQPGAVYRHSGETGMLEV